MDQKEHQAKLQTLITRSLNLEATRRGVAMFREAMAHKMPDEFLGECIRLILTLARWEWGEDVSVNYDGEKFKISRGRMEETL